VLNVTDNYKLIDLEIDGKPRTLKINTSDAWGVMDVQTESGVVTVNEGDKIEFVTENNGEIVKGIPTKIKGKGEKTNFEFVADGSECKQVWDVMAIKEGTLKLIKEEKEEDTEEEENEEEEE